MGLPQGLNERFELLEQLASVSLLDCFRVRDRADAEECLLKVLPSTLANNGTVQASFRDFFMRYGQIPGRRVPQRLDFKAAKGISYVLEEFASGMAITALERSKTLSDEAVRVLEEACEALNLAHLKGVYHLCLRPEDIAVTSDSSVRLAGFGAAVFLNTGHLSQLDDRSRQFCAPEVMEGKASPSSDVYSLAAVIQDCFPRVSRHDVIAQALAKDPRHRFNNILSFQAELSDVFASPTPQEPPKPRKAGTVVEKLIIHVQPSGAEILVKGETGLKWSKSPDTLEILGEPEHWDRGITIEICKQGYHPRTLEISGPPETDEHVVNLNPANRAIIIKTSPPEARVRTADRQLGVTDVETGLRVTWARDLRLIIEKEGYESVTHQLPATAPPDLTEEMIRLPRREISLRIIDQILVRVRDAQRFLARPELSAFQLPPGQEAFTEWIEDLEKQRFLSTQRFSVMLLGEYNSGKSTLLNALLGLPSHRQLPVADGPATAKPTRLTYRNPGDPESAWVMHDLSEEPKTWDEAIGQASTKSTDLDDRIREIKLYLDHPLLRQADIMDMPGTGAGWFEEHADITRDYLNTAEMLILVIGRVTPGKEVARDLHAVRQFEVPFDVVFNAWGCLDSERNRRISPPDQDTHESNVRALFPWVFTDHPGSRVYARKCLEARQMGRDIPEEWGLTAFQSRFQEACLDEFLGRSSSRREKIRKRVVEEALTSADNLKEFLHDWRQQLVESGNEGRVAERIRRRMDSAERTIRRRVGTVADAKSKEILDRFCEASILFIRDNLRLDTKLIRSLIKRSLGKDGRQVLNNELNDRLTTDYLQLDKQDNWLQRSIRDYLQECLPIVREEWESLVVKIDLGASTHPRFDRKPALPVDTLARAAIDGAQAIIASLFNAGAVFGILLLIPGKIILDIVIALGVLIWQGNPMERMRQRAIERVRLEMDQQRSAFRQELVDYVMNGVNAEFRSAVQRETGGARDGRTFLLQQGITCIQELQQFLEDVGCASK